MSLDELTFELERFDWQGPERLEVRGRWFGVRGQRFMRPTLHLKAGGRRRRLIAALDHKPWAPDDDGVWIAAFAWRGSPEDHVTGARLELTPEIVLDLGAPGEAASGQSLTPRPRPRRVAKPKPAPVAPARAAAPPTSSPGAAASSPPPPTSARAGAPSPRPSRRASGLRET
ncbi:hypothetical protein OJ962_01300, partial [Solirubrobacter sp. CPCC 204708]|nr:hypothetical protein [Solirubrobacter deserti]